MKFGTVAGIDKPISRLVQGTIPIGTKDLDAAFALLDGVVEQGGNAFDTAHGYGGGDNERAFGKWMAARGNRDSLVILSKGAHHNSDRKRVTPYDIASDLHDSLARMQVESVDLYVLHRDDPSVPVGPIVEALNEHRRNRLISAFGGSNWTHTRIAEANAYAAENGLVPFAVSSPNYSLADQVKEPWSECVTISGPSNAPARSWYLQQNMPLFPWSSLAGGFFSGRLDRTHHGDPDNWQDKLAIECYASDANYERLARVRQLASERGLTVPQVALAFVMHQPLNIFALVGSRSADEYAINAQALNTNLSAGELAWLDLERENRP